ncbi:ShlB/FhaC/HecB family hemolysin secretion/activation protein [Marinobacter sp. BGYM27]|uniref:ShlB/FhaC/HecB family hemolysin secretion/activation protein n=1 Tax=Marinobacter sp. BGYM27 TaxID=2975597 RepID=UPI0021A8C3D7|nr:ShlB/FhaC/HecB family hemolysin secretion/activation protein [Marinobacter sp. BGYM27]MDG5498985.1 ShlB/FhaC/HecB family hemolysin secretion/activation protein [Marinobacter sp. BGYM27]
MLLKSGLRKEWVSIGFTLLGSLLSANLYAVAQSPETIEWQRQTDISRQLYNRDVLPAIDETEASLAATTKPDSKPADWVDQWPKGRCVTIKSFNLPGLLLLPTSMVTQVQSLVQPNSGQCVDPERVSGITQTINSLFASQGWGTTRAYVPDNALRNGTLTMRVELGASKSPADEVISNAEIKTSGQRLSLLDYAPDYDSHDIVINDSAISAPVDSAAQSSARIHTVRRHWLGSRFSLAGESQNMSDERRGHIDVIADDLASANDALQFQYRRASANRLEARSQGFGFDYSFPWRNNDFAINFERYDYEDTVVGSDRIYEVSGDTRVIDFSGRRTLLDFNGTRLESLMGLSTKENNSFEDGYRLDNSSRQYTIMRFEGRLSQDLWLDTTAVTSLSAEQGLDAFGAGDNDIPESDGTSQFSKYTFYGSLSKPVWLWTWGLSGRYQYTPDILPGSEKMLIAGSSLVSGFGGQSLVAGQGGWLRFDASSPAVPFPLTSTLTSDVRLSLLKGWAPNTEGQSDNYGSASAAEVSLRLTGQRMSAGLSVGKMLGASSDAASPPELPDVKLSFSLGI